MHYVRWHVADYAIHTAHLTLLEDLAYRRCLDLYYLHERPLPLNLKALTSAVRMLGHENEVRAVVAQFFVRTKHGFTNKRADAEIAHVQDKSAKASRAGLASVARRNNGRTTTTPEADAERPLPVENAAAQVEARQTLNGRGTTVQPPSTQYPVPNPLTPKGEPEGAIAPRSEGGGPETAAHRAAWRELQRRLLATPYRSKLQHLQRGIVTREKAEALAAAGVTVEDFAQLVADDAAGADTPGAWLAKWLDEGTWADQLAEHHRRRKEAEAARRTADAAAADPLRGVYGGDQ